MKKITVVVLGDVGRSPRMQYHALSCAREEFLVNIVGYKGSEPISELTEHKNVKFSYLLDCPNFKDYIASTPAYLLKAIWQSITLFIALILAGIPNCILVQNPPSIPTLGVVYVFSKLTFSQFIIDWHNYGYTILAISLGENAKLVRLCRWFEFFFGRRSHKNLCVTRAMKDDLLLHEIKAVTLYDRPPECFKPLTLEEKHDLFKSLGSEYKIFLQDCSRQETLFTKANDDGVVTLKPNRPGLLISSTSWTEDEDFYLLLRALQDYEDAKIGGSPLPDLVLAITGKGPLRAFYVEVMAKRNWQHIKFITPWLTAQDYPKFLACADLGVSLHFSSSGLDLPMKVVDMFGCGLPVCAVKFKCLNELVQHKENGLVFTDSNELGEQLQDWFKGFPETADDATWRSTIKNNITSFRNLRWHENWLLNVKPILQ